ncbi:hypothetical protein IWW50_004684, partial [Coemansia erecta]
MSENEELRQQIQQLERAINQRKFQRPNSRFNPLRPPMHYTRPPMRASHNMKLTVKPPTAADSDSGSSTGYVSYANKLVRVGSGSGSIRPQYRPPALVWPKVPKQPRGPRKIVIDGETFMRRGNGKKLVRASTLPTKAQRKQARVVSIDGEDYVRSNKGSLVKLGALQALNKRRQRPSARRKRLCTKHLFGRCEHSAEECRYSHELSPEVVP